MTKRRKQGGRVGAIGPLSGSQREPRTRGDAHSGLSLGAPTARPAGAERGEGAPASDGDGGSGGAKPPGLSRTRFAPAPTGYLHLGHVLNAEHVWGAARLLDASVLLRIEDHDRDRSRPEFEAAILDDLDWLGFRADIFPAPAYRAGRCDGRQSDRGRSYEAAAARLEAAGLLFGCGCTRTELASAPRSPAGEVIHAGACRERRQRIAPGVGWRLGMDDGIEGFEDLRLGAQGQEPARQCGDMLIRDRLGNWTYQFAVTVDDWLQEIDLVIRGIDLLESTGRQIRLARLLGRHEPPRFLHHALVMKTATQKLSKSDRDTGVRDLRAAGWTAVQVLDAARDRLQAGGSPPTTGGPTGMDDGSDST